jgi:hypothetical protein
MLFVYCIQRKIFLLPFKQKCHVAVPKPRQESDQLFIYVNGIDCASVSMIFLLDSRNILT